ncbi:MAG TPA: CDP-alcohol phosphatidyltransferase family protein [Bryobacteraceae bacterium]
MTPAREADTWRTVPNLITALRILLIVPFIYYAVHGRDFRAVVIFFIASMSDTIDGTLARWLNQMSKLGRLVDPVADKVLTGISYVVLSCFRGGYTAIPGWLMASVVIRDVLILLGCWIVYRATRDLGFRPTVFGKLNTFLELLTIGWFLTTNVFPVVGPFLPWMYAMTGASIVISFADYARQGIRMMRAR